jgi:polar amino acid transport system permease protein
MSLLDSLVAVIRENQTLLLRGLGITLRLLLYSSVIAFTLALPIALARVSQSALLRRGAYGFAWAFRGTPLITQLFLIYYGLSQFEWVRASALWPILRDPFPCAMIALSLNMSAYLSEALRGGIAGVPPGEREAAIAMGMGPWLLNRRIILPRAIGIALPSLANETVIQLKSTALVSTITLLDMTGAARRIEARTYSTEALLVAGLFYVAATWAIGRGFRMIERRVNRHLA